MAKAKQFWEKDYSAHIGACALLLSSFIGLVFIVCGTPDAVFVDRVLTKRRTKCYTMWGIRPNCTTPAYDWRIEQDPCTARRHRFEFAEAFSIIAMFFYVMTFGLSWYCISGSKVKWWAFGFALTSIGSVTVTWGCVASLYNQSFCGDNSYTKAHKKYGAGFALLVTAFCVQCVGVILLLALEK